MENQDVSGYSDFFLVEGGLLEEKKQILVNTIFSITFSVKTTFSHLYIQLLYKYVVRLQHYRSHSALITTIIALIRIKPLFGFE